MQVTVLGASGTYAGPGGACSGYLLRHAGCCVAVDIGPGTLANLGGQIALTELDGVVLSHEHPDHWLELPVLRNALKYVLGHAGLAVYGTSATHALAEVLCHGDLEPTFEWHTISDGSAWGIGPFDVRASRTDHPPETLGIAVGDGRGWFGYSADTGDGWSMSAFDVPIDLAVWETTVLDRDRADVAGVHSSAARVGELARLAGVRDLVVTHLLPGSDPEDFRAEAAATYGSPVHVAQVGATFTP